MSRGYVLQNPPVVDATGGDPSTGTIWNSSFETTRLGLYQLLMTLIDNDMTFVFNQLGAEAPDNVSFKYKNSVTVTVSAGVAGAFTILNETDVDFTGASVLTYYYLWVGEDSVTGFTTIVKGTSLITPPAGIIAGTAHRLRWYVLTDGSGNVAPFWFPFGNDIDDVIYQYIDADTVQVKAGGQFIAHDGARYRIEVNTNVTLSGNLSADAGGESADTFYYLWGGEDSNGDLEFWFSDSGTILPSELVKGRVLRAGVSNDSSSNILQFWWDGFCYEYITPQQIYNASLGFIYTTITCTPFVPSIRSRAGFIVQSVPIPGSINLQNYWHSIRQKGTPASINAVTYSAYNNGGIIYNIIKGIYEASLDENGQYEAVNTDTRTTTINIIGFYTP